MSSLGHLLERLRRMQLPPGAAARTVAVPSAGDDLVTEVAFLFDDLDRIVAHGARALAAARSEAEAIEGLAREQRRRLLEDARAEADRVGVQLLAERRAVAEGRAQALLAESTREAERVLTRGRQRTSPLVAEIAQRVLEGPR